MPINIPDNRPQADKDKAVEKKEIRDSINDIKLSIDSIKDKAVFDALSNAAKWELLRRGLLKGLRAIIWLLKQNL